MEDIRDSDQESTALAFNQDWMLSNPILSCFQAKAKQTKEFPVQAELFDVGTNARQMSKRREDLGFSSQSQTLCRHS